jgi:hypothetical protein
MIYEEFEIKFENIENEMEIRLESIISDAYKFQDDFKKRLNSYKNEFKK